MRPISPPVARPSLPRKPARSRRTGAGKRRVGPSRRQVLVPRRSARLHRPELEHLENPVVLSTINRSGGAGTTNWATAANWVGGVLSGGPAADTRPGASSLSGAMSPPTARRAEGNK
jgi:hypothetical protein